MANDSLAKAAGKGVTLTLADKVYKITPLNIDDLAGFESYIRGCKIKDFVAGAGDLVSSEEKIKIVTDMASGILSALDFTKEMQTVRGLRYLAWRSLRKSHEELKLEDMGSLVNLDNFEMVNTVIQTVGGMEDAPKNPPAEAPAQPVTKS